jgi:hypothetical protein
MPLSEGVPRRNHIHTRSLRFEGYRRQDGLYDIEGWLVDVKPMSIQLASGEVPAGRHIHEMLIRLTIDRKLNVLAAEAVTDAEPYPGYCETITPDYHRLVGTNLGKGFRKAVSDLLGKVRGCAHLNEMLGQFPTAAIQTLAGEQRDTDDTHGKPFQLDRCHALDTHGEGVRRYYPRWYRGVKTGTTER